MAAVRPGSIIVGRAGYSAGQRQIEITNPTDYSANETDSALSIATLIFGDASLRYRRTSLFRFAKPNSQEDAQNGQVCSKKGWWAPAHRIVYVDGLPYIDIYAPKNSGGRSNANWLN